MKKYKNIFITGSTGFLGGYIVAHLLEQSPHHLYCLVRPSKNKSPEKRLLERIFSVNPGIHFNPDRIHILEGSLQTLDLIENQIGVGLIDEVLHCAAVLNFEQYKEQETLQANFGGLKNLLNFMESRSIPLINFVSTAYVAGKANGRIPESLYVHEHEHINPYELSKRLCEKEIILRSNQKKLQYRIFRPSIIIGDSKSLRADSPSGLYGYLAILLRFKDKLELKMPDYFRYNTLQLLISPGASLNLICVDHVTKLLCAVCETPDTLNEVFHLSNPLPIPIERTVSLLSEILNIQIVPVYTETALSPIDYLLSTEADIFNSYLKTDLYFECDKAFQYAPLEKQELILNQDQEYLVLKNIKEKFDSNALVQRQRQKSIIHKIPSFVLNLPGQEPLTYYCGGKGPVLVILNAYGQSLAFWDRMVDQLLRQGFKIIIWSMRGTSSQVGGVSQVYDIETHREDIKAILDLEQVENCHILAWCTGPKIALSFQKEYPARVSSMIFLSGCFKGIPAFSPLHTQYENDMQVICSRVDANPEITGFVIDTLKKLLAGNEDQSKFEHPSMVDEEKKRNYIHEIMGLLSKDVKSMVIEPFLSVQSALNYGRQLLLFWNHDVSKTIQELTVPVLMVSGTEDKIASCTMSQAVSGLSPNSRFLRIQGGSHYLHFDNTDFLTEIVKKFISEGTQFNFRHSLVKLEN